jgi:hypothetical protein
MSELKPIEQEVTELMNAHAKLLSEDLPEGYGFALLAYKHGKPDEHRMNIITDTTPETLIPALRELIANMEGNAHEPPKGKQ